MTPTVGMRISSLTVERAVGLVLAEYLPAYVVQAARRLALEGQTYGTDDGPSPTDLEALLRNDGPDGLPFRARSMNTASAFDDWHVGSLPHIQIISPSYTRAGGDEAGGHYTFEVQVACLVSAADQASTRFIRACWEEAIPGVLENHQDLDGLAAQIAHRGGGSATFDTLAEQDSRTLQGSIDVFDILVQRVLDPKHGPVQAPGDDAYGVPLAFPEDPYVAQDGVTVDLQPDVPRPL